MPMTDQATKHDQAPSDRLPPYQACPLCGHSGLADLCVRESKHGQWQLTRCSQCGLNFTQPPPSSSEIANFYSGDYHADLRQANGSEDAFGPKYERYLRWLARYAAGGRVIDVGCSCGLLVKMLADRGYEAAGVEVNESSAAWGREHYGITIHQGMLETCDIASQSLDAIVLTDLVEHTPHPLRYMELVKSLLAPGGIALVTFPDILSLDSRYLRVLSQMLRRPWIWSTCFVPLHVWEFTFPTATAMFHKAGFEVVAFQRTPRPGEQERDWRLRLLKAPLSLLNAPGLSKFFGGQMEFILRKAA